MLETVAVPTESEVNLKIMAVVTLRKMLENGVHFGHQTRKWDPNMKPCLQCTEEDH